MFRVVGRFLSLAILLIGTVFADAATAARPFQIIVTEAETPLVPNSVIDLADRLGYYKKAGVDVELIRVRATPVAVAALQSGQGDMANIGFDLAVQLIARDQMNLRGVISPNRALPYVIIAKNELTSVKQLAGKIFGVGQIGSVDYVQSRSVLANLGVDVDSVRYLPVGLPAVRGQSLLAGQIDASTVTLGSWLTLPNRGSLHLLVDQADYYKAAPFITKLNVVTAQTAKDRQKDVAAVVRAIVMASRDFAAHPELWVEAMATARPDVPRAQLEILAKAFARDWSVDGGLDPAELTATTDALYKTPDFQSLPRRVVPSEWIDKSFIEAVIRDQGEYRAPPNNDK